MHRPLFIASWLLAPPEAYLLAGWLANVAALPGVATAWQQQISVYQHFYLDIYYYYYYWSLVTGHGLRPPAERIAHSISYQPAASSQPSGMHGCLVLAAWCRWAGSAMHTQ